jgi:hypothetical protein
MINAIERLKDEKIVICNGRMRSWLFQSIFDCLHIWVMQGIPQQMGTGQIVCLIAFFHGLVLCFQKWKCQSESKIRFCLAYSFLRIPPSTLGLRPIWKWVECPGDVRTDYFLPVYWWKTSRAIYALIRGDLFLSYLLSHKLSLFKQLLTNILYFSHFTCILCEKRCQITNVVKAKKLLRSWSWEEGFSLF